jgi:hypothetical protein
MRYDSSVECPSYFRLGGNRDREGGKASLVSVARNSINEGGAEEIRFIVGRQALRSE